MTSSDHDRRWYRDPPPGFFVLRESEVDPGHGRDDRWVCRGTLLGRRVVRSGLRSRAAACRAAWFNYDDAATLGLVPPLDEGEVAVATREAERKAEREKRCTGNPNMAEVYSVRLDSWEHMEAALLCRIIDDAGSIRKAAKVIGIPRSSLGRRVKNHRDRGTWPR